MTSNIHGLFLEPQLALAPKFGIQKLRNNAAFFCMPPFSLPSTFSVILLQQIGDLILGTIGLKFPSKSKLRMKIQCVLIVFKTYGFGFLPKPLRCLYVTFRTKGLCGLGCTCLAFHPVLRGELYSLTLNEELRTVREN